MLFDNMNTEPMDETEVKAALRCIAKTTETEFAKTFRKQIRKVSVKNGVVSMPLPVLHLLLDLADDYGL